MSFSQTNTALKEDSVVDPDSLELIKEFRRDLYLRMALFLAVVAIALISDKWPNAIWVVPILWILIEPLVKGLFYNWLLIDLSIDEEEISFHYYSFLFGKHSWVLKTADYQDISMAFKKREKLTIHFKEENGSSEQDFLFLSKPWSMLNQKIMDLKALKK
ncbi:hypothetical protein [Croceimicrobium hydrocarbonivorans]|uniref:Uncharacterized protein n=1 Tax=Croceimicrobium hydrocarbonivorans TaxID=2761580 RepID=A0A7H0VDV7_9FLAO|nr:hypothetical protein [Croceimicrobium hydrocarbonivorans]QNR23905.1 hypothetical protein H4K34_16235 [Croceimicrobium hydrocarbonivorans]